MEMLKRFYLAVGHVLYLVFGMPRLRLMATDYDDYWKDKRGSDGLGKINDFQRMRAEWILDRIEPGSAVMDIGCGDGGILLHIAAKKRISPIGADISDYTLEFLEGKGVRAVKFDMNSAGSVVGLPEADHILLLEVLEHIQNPEAFLKSILPKARKSIFFSVPNTGYFPYRLRMLFGRFPVQWRIHPGEHLRFWTYADIRWWLDEMGLAKRSVTDVYKGIPGFNRIWKNLMGMCIICEIKAVDPRSQAREAEAPQAALNVP
jgi:methionine biosynthesis protein MetW